MRVDNASFAAVYGAPEDIGSYDGFSRPAGGHNHDGGMGDERRSSSLDGLDLIVAEMCHSADVA